MERTRKRAFASTECAKLCVSIHVYKMLARGMRYIDWCLRRENSRC